MFTHLNLTMMAGILAPGRVGNMNEVTCERSLEDVVLQGR